MSILESIRGNPGPKPPHLAAPDIERRLRAAESAFADLDRKHGEAALDALTGDPAAVARHNDMKGRIAAAHENVTTLTAAYQAALSRDAAALEGQRDALRKTQRMAQRKHLEAVDAAVTALAASAADAVRHFHAAIERAEKAIAATPIGSTYPDGVICTPGGIRRQLMAELFRLSSDGDSINGSNLREFPGAACDLFYVDQPRAIKPLTDAIREDIAAILKMMADKKGAD